MSHIKSAIRFGLRRQILRWGLTNRIHIFGAARSGTTLMHCAMAAFDHTIIHSKESNIYRPGLWSLLKFGMKNHLSGASRNYVTKRAYGWYQPSMLEAFCSDAIKGDYGVIYMVRDPADVLTSRHRGVTDRKFYLEPSRWLESVKAGYSVEERLAGHVPFLVVRYEDLVSEPEVTRAKIESTFGLKLRPSVNSWSDLGANVDADAIGQLSTALHSIRSFDASSIGKWMHDDQLAVYWNELATSAIRDELTNFCDRYRYDSVSQDVGG